MKFEEVGIVPLATKKKQHVNNIKGCTNIDMKWAY